MMSNEEWRLVSTLYDAVRLLAQSRLGCDPGTTNTERQQSLQEHYRSVYTAAKEARTVEIDEKEALRQRIADLEQELAEARAKLPRQVRIDD